MKSLTIVDSLQRSQPRREFVTQILKCSAYEHNIVVPPDPKANAGIYGTTSHPQYTGIPQTCKRRSIHESVSHTRLQSDENGVLVKLKYIVTP